MQAHDGELSAEAQKRLGQCIEFPRLRELIPPAQGIGDFLFDFTAFAKVFGDLEVIDNSWRYKSG